MPLLPADLSASPAASGASSVPDTATTALPDDVVAFAQKNGLGDYLRKAIEFVNVAFAGFERIEFELRQDPESDDTWIVLRVCVRAENVNVPLARRQYTAAWVGTVPSTHRSRIRLSPDIL